MFDSRGCTHWGSVRLIIEAFFLAAAPPLEEREGDENMNETKAVPVEPTEEMNLAGEKGWCEQTNRPLKLRARDCYVAMLAASPAPQERKIGQRRLHDPYHPGGQRHGKPDRRAAPNAAGQENEAATGRSEIASASPVP